MNEQDWKQKKNTHKNRKHITYCDRGWSVEVEKSIFCLLIKVYSFPEIDCMTFQPKNVRQFAVSKFRIFRVHELSLGLFILSHSWLYLNFNFNSAHFKTFHYEARSSMHLHTLHTPAILLEDLKMCCECNTQVETSFSFFSHNYNTIWFAVLLGAIMGECVSKQFAFVVYIVNHGTPCAIDYIFGFCFGYQMRSSKICTLDIIYITHTQAHPYALNKVVESIHSRRA